jgi:hypothetical protein
VYQNSWVFPRIRGIPENTLWIRPCVAATRHAAPSSPYLGRHSVVVWVAGAGGGALLGEHDEEGVEAAEQRVDAAGGQAGDGTGAGGAQQNQLTALCRAVHRPTKPWSRSRSIPHCSSPPGRPWLPTTSCFKCFRRFRLMFQAFHLNLQKSI